jgi:hypothetical protein
MPYFLAVLRQLAERERHQRGGGGGGGHPPRRTPRRTYTLGCAAPGARHSTR